MRPSTGTLRTNSALAGKELACASSFLCVTDCDRAPMCHVQGSARPVFSSSQYVLKSAVQLGRDQTRGQWLRI